MCRLFNSETPSVTVPELIGRRPMLRYADIANVVVIKDQKH